MSMLTKYLSKLDVLTNQKYQWLIQPLIAFLISRLIVWAAAYLAEIAIPGMLSDGFYHVNPNNIFLDIWARWDSGFYLGIATNGYSYVVGQQSSVAFFPVYPLLMNVVAQWVGSALLAGVLVSNALFFGSLIFLYLLTEHEFDSEVAARAVFYIATFPTAFFFSAVYTESTFLFFLLGSVYFARRRIWGWAVLMGLICSASRIVGFITFGVTGLEWLNSHGWYLGRIHHRSSWVGLWQGLRSDWFSLLIIFIIPLGMLSYMRFLGYYFNDPIAFSTVQSAWGRETVGFWVVLYRDAAAFFTGDFLTGRIWYHIALDLAPSLLVLSLLYWMWRKMGESYAILSALSILIPMSSGSQSLSRYVLVVFPFFMALGVIGKNQLIDRFLMTVFGVFLGVFTGLFVNWIFIA